MSKNKNRSMTDAETKLKELRENEGQQVYSAPQINKVKLLERLKYLHNKATDENKPELERQIKNLSASIERKRPKSQSGFPWVSTLSLLYPAGATLYIVTNTPTSLIMSIGYGLAQLGYLLFAAGLMFGKFGVFGLNRRTPIVILAFLSFMLGTFLTNIGLD